MKVAIFYDSAKLKDVEKIKDIISSHDCVVQLYDNDEIQELQDNMRSPRDVMKM